MGVAGTAGSASILFGPFELDLAAGCLRCDGRIIPLRPKAWQLLVHLAARPGVLVATEELYEAVWSGTAVTPNAMTNVIGEVRRALGDVDGEARFLETVRGRGYRFIAGVRQAPSSAGAPRQATDRPRPGFVGRDAELGQLRIAWGEAGSTGRRAVFVTGEPGIGKSTLIERFVDGLGEEDYVVAHCIEAHGSSEAYQPILHALEQLLRRPRRDEVERVLRRFAPTWLCQLPGLLGGDEARELSQSLLGVGSGRMLREGATLFEELTRTEPLTLVLEDLHWADQPTVELIGVLMQRSDTSRLLLVGTYRPIDAVVHNHPIAATVSRLQQIGGARSISLSAFSMDEVRRCLASDFSDDALAAAVAEPVGRHSGGNPLFVKAVARQLREEGWVRRDGQRWELKIDLARFVPRLPEHLRDLIELQIESLPEDSLRVLETASIAGDGVSVPLLADALEWEPARVEDICHELTRRSFYLRASATRAVLDGEPVETFDFTHSLYQRAFQDRIAPSRRRSLHARVGELVERAHAADPGAVAARLATHFEKAGNWDRAAHHREAAAGVALRRLAYGECARELELALGHLERATDAADLDARRARMLLWLGNTRIGLRGYTHPSVNDAFEDAERSAAAAGDVRSRIRALSGIGTVRLGDGSPRSALEVAERQLALAAAGDLAQYTFLRAGHVQLLLGNLRSAEAFLERAAGSAPEPGVPVLVDAVSEQEAWRALVFAQLGQTGRAREAGQRALQRAEAAGLAWGRGSMLYLVLETAVLLRDFGWATSLAGALARNAQRYDLPAQRPIAEFQQQYLLGLATSPAAVVADVRAHLRRHEAFGERWHRTVHLAQLAEIEAGSGDLDAAEATLDAAFAQADRGGEGRHLPELWRLRAGVIRRRVEDPAAGEDCLRRAIALAAARESLLFELRSSVELAKMLQGSGRREDVAAVLAPVCRKFRDAGGDGPDLREAVELLDGAGG